MDLQLTSKIVLNKVPEELYRPDNEVIRSQLTRYEKISTKVVSDMSNGIQWMADQVANVIRDCNCQDRACVIAMDTEQSLIPLWQELIRRYQKGLVSFKHVIVFTIHEFYPLPDYGKGNVVSSRLQLCSQLLNHVDVCQENIFTPSGKDTVTDICRQYEELILSKGGIDLLLMGVGRNGNIGVNEPGSVSSSVTRLMLMDETTREEMAHHFSRKETIPSCAVTMGVKTLLSARRILLAAWGEEKADIIRMTVEGEQTSTIPASFLQLHNNTTVVTDIAAAALLTRIVHPWLVTSCRWTDKLVRSALVWLCMQTGKPILKLTNKDYNEYGLSELLANYGSAYNANIKIFNDLQHTITGWPGGKPNADDSNRPERALPFPKRIIVFSPHPDDDVISMGGTLRRLVQQGHIVHVAYETSGNIAVGDEEVIRFMHFINGFNQLFCNNNDEVIRKKYCEIKAFLDNKNTGDMDNREILTIKGLIRRGEARTASAYNGIPLERVHFLDLPFYESGKIEKNPMTADDVQIIRQLLQKIKPHQIYVAGDLADPHGTHRKCTDAVLAALEEEQVVGALWLDDCRVWMYRGAWAEWEIENIEMCVPISPEELRAKRNSILKHQSQMESAPFLGNDERLFWQRAEDRNRATAQLYNRLGLADYEAMEAFVEYHLYGN